MVSKFPRPTWGATDKYLPPRPVGIDPTRFAGSPVNRALPERAAVMSLADRPPVIAPNRPTAHRGPRI